MPSKMYMICNSYESGFGKGLDGVNVTNPYKKGEKDSLNRDCYEAWDIGYKEGQKRFKESTTLEGKNKLSQAHLDSIQILLHPLIKCKGSRTPITSSEACQILHDWDQARKIK